MTTVIMLFLFPIGILTFFWDKKVYAQGIETYREFIKKIKNADLSDKEKTLKIDHMFYDNDYKIIHRDETTLEVQKKHFNIGILIMVFGIFNYFGAIAYVAFYKFFLKPRTLKIDINSDDVLTKHLP